MTAPVFTALPAESYAYYETPGAGGLHLVQLVDVRSDGEAIAWCVDCGKIAVGGHADDVPGEAKELFLSLLRTERLIEEPKR